VTAAPAVEPAVPRALPQPVPDPIGPVRAPDVVTVLMIEPVPPVFVRAPVPPDVRADAPVDPSTLNWRFEVTLPLRIEEIRRPDQAFVRVDEAVPSFDLTAWEDVPRETRAQLQAGVWVIWTPLVPPAPGSRGLYTIRGVYLGERGDYREN
jgi:hypothetical protein